MKPAPPVTKTFSEVELIEKERFDAAHLPPAYNCGLSAGSLYILNW